jgi:hypothetical protein
VHEQRIEKSERTEPLFFWLYRYRTRLHECRSLHRERNEAPLVQYCTIRAPLSRLLLHFEDWSARIYEKMSDLSMLRAIHDICGTSFRSFVVARKRNRAPSFVSSAALICT